MSNREDRLCSRWNWYFGRTCRNTIIQRIAGPSRASWHRWRGFDQPAVNKGVAVARLSTCQTGFTSVRSQYSSRFAIQFQFGRKWIPAVNFAAERKRRENVSRCNSVTETNLLILFAPPREKNLIKRKIPYSPWNYDERGGQGETRGGGRRRGWIIFIAKYLGGHFCLGWSFSLLSSLSLFFNVPSVK